MASHNSYKLLLRPAALFLMLPCLWAQNSSGGHLSAGQPQKVTGKRNEAVQAKIPITVDAGYHVNSNKPAEEDLIPLRLTWTSTGALEGGEVVFPKPSLEKYEFSKEPLSVFTGSFNLVVNFKIGATA